VPTGGISGGTTNYVWPMSLGVEAKPLALVRRGKPRQIKIRAAGTDNRTDLLPGPPKQIFLSETNKNIYDIF